MILILGDRLYKDHGRVKDEISSDLGGSLFKTLPDRLVHGRSGKNWSLSPGWTKKLKER